MRFGGLAGVLARRGAGVQRADGRCSVHAGCPQGYRDGDAGQARAAPALRRAADGQAVRWPAWRATPMLDARRAAQRTSFEGASGIALG